MAPPLASPEPAPGPELVGIIGGCPVSARRFPWQVSLRFYSRKSHRWEHMCGGSHIHPQWVLTAAHCVEPQDFWACAFKVQVGQLRLYEEDRLTKVVQIIRHPKYNESLSVLGGGDIALLRLEGAVKLSESVYPVSLPDASLTVSSKKICWVTGWGDIRVGEPLPWPFHLQEVKVKVMRNKDCDHTYRFAFPSKHIHQFIKDDMLCAGSSNYGPCPGDSGGPLVCTWVQVGVVSWDNVCSHCSLPAVYTRVMSVTSSIQHYVPQFSGL
uniref:Peptidase S1 domain-containing protein n=1 Tax=Castor canadensis TaxID=51338 RepID=A0A8C0XUI2_CASCN